MNPYGLKPQNPAQMTLSTPTALRYKRKAFFRRSVTRIISQAFDREPISACILAFNWRFR
jgi:hypothetical protein